MRVLMLTQFYPPVIGGQERHVRDLAHALFERGHAVEVATIASDRAPGTDRDGPVAVHRLRGSAQRLPGVYSDRTRPHAPPISDPGLSRALRRLLEARPFDVAHAHDWSVNSLLGPARSTGVPVVLTQHDYSHVCPTKRLLRQGAPCPGPQLGRCLSCASEMHGPVVGPGVVLANLGSRRRRERDVRAFVPVSGAVAGGAPAPGDALCEIIPNFVPDSLLIDDSDVTPPEKDAPLLFVGDLSVDKGIAVLLAAYTLMTDPPPLLLAGRVLPDMPSSTPPGATMLGPLPADQVRALMRSAVAVVVPSIWADPCPTVVLEAMAAGRAVVGSAIGGIVDLVEDGATGLTVPPGEARALAGALDRMVGDPETATAWGRRGLERARRFTASVVAERVEQLYRRVAPSAS